MSDQSKTIKLEGGPCNGLQVSPRVPGVTVSSKVVLVRHAHREEYSVYAREVGAARAVYDGEHSLEYIEVLASVGLSLTRTPNRKEVDAS